MAGFFGRSRGHKRNINANLNLVPFIDLFSTIILFLISIAVWDELASVPTNLAAQDKATLDTPKEDIRKVTSNVYLSVNSDTVDIFNEGKKQSIKKNGEAYDFLPIDQFLADIRTKFADKKDMLIYANDMASYEDLIAVMDRCLGQKFDDLIVTGADQKM